jgi:predicted small lipoprotein YifL
MRDFSLQRTLHAWTALAALATLTGCTDKVPPPAPQPTTSVTPDSVQSVFTARCAKAGCHVTGTAAFDEVLEASNSYAAIVNVPSGEKPAFMRIRPFLPDSSYLVKKIRGDGDIIGGRMPADGPPFLTPAESSTVVNWVKNGAPATQVPVGPSLRATAMR